MATEIKTRKELPKDPIVIEAFPSKGFVSTIAAKYMIDELGMEVIGSIKSDKVQSIAVVHTHVPMYPIRIYKKDKMILIFSEVNVPFQYVGEFTQAINKWFLKIKPQEVILLAGISGKSTEKEHEIFSITTDEKVKKKLKNLKVEYMDEGMLTGISSDLLLFCVDNNIPVTSLMAETHYTPDPLGSASMLEILNGLLDLKINTKKLIEKGEEVEKMFQNISEQMKKGIDDTKQISEYSPMYG
ncbi:MAG: proteasome assembly chaperone family protein [Candidatus Altiarchaeota archaeon]|nr:proteasome assembly chaperone family protein [Candidatus Altiarchaeota archaeon]